MFVPFDVAGSVVLGRILEIYLLYLVYILGIYMRAGKYVASRTVH